LKEVVTLFLLCVERECFIPNIFWAKPADYKKATLYIWHASNQASTSGSPARCRDAAAQFRAAGVGAALVERLELCGIAYVDRAERLQYLWSAIIAYGV
jgi:hypothetical protein